MSDISEFEDFHVVEDVVQGLIEVVVRTPQDEDDSRLVPRTLELPQYVEKEEAEKEVQEVPDPTTNAADDDDDDRENQEGGERAEETVPEFVIPIQLEIEVGQEEEKTQRLLRPRRKVLGELQVQEVPDSNSKRKTPRRVCQLQNDEPNDLTGDSTQSLFGSRTGCLLDVYSIEMDDEDKENVALIPPPFHPLHDHSYAQSANSSVYKSSIHAAIRVDTSNARLRVGLSRSTPVPPLHPYLRRWNQNGGNR